MYPEVGSSPRVWGVRAGWRSPGGCSRFIPTGVGRARKQPERGCTSRFIPTGVGRAAGTQAEGVEANHFAGLLLMPLELIEHEFGWVVPLIGKALRC